MIKKIMNKALDFIGKNYKILMLIIAIITIILVILLAILNTKTKPIITIIELGNRIIDIDDPHTFFDESSIRLEGCKIKSNIDVNKVGKYSYELICPKKTYGKYKIKVIDSVSPTAIKKKMTILPGNGIKKEDLFLDIYDLSNYHLEYASHVEEKYDIGAYDINIKVTDDYGNSKIETIVLNVSENAPVKTIKCDNLNIVGRYPSTYYISLTKDDKIFDIRRETEFTYDNDEYYINDLKGYKKEGLIFGVDGEAIIKNNYIKLYNYILDIDYQDEFNIKYQPTNKDDMYKIFNNNCEDVKE